MMKSLIGGVLGLAIAVSGPGALATAQDKSNETEGASEKSVEDTAIDELQDAVELECTSDLCLTTPCSDFLGKSDADMMEFISVFGLLGWKGYMKQFEVTEHLIEKCENAPDQTVGDALNTPTSEADKRTKRTQEKSAG